MLCRRSRRRGNITLSKGGIELQQLRLMADTFERAAAPGSWDFFISHTQRSGQATTLAAELHSDFKDLGFSSWLDVKMDDRSEAGMREGVENCSVVIAILTLPCINPDRPGDPPDSNAYFSEPFCIQELRWAREAGVPILPVIGTTDKQRIGDLIAAAPDDLKDLVNTDFITLDRSGTDYWKVGIDKIIKAAARMIGAGNISKGGIELQQLRLGTASCNTLSHANRSFFVDRSEPAPPPVTDVFLSHNWGQDALDRDNHDRVLRVNDLLTDAGYTTWCDSEQMIGDVVDRMVEGIDNTRVVLVFITRRYMEKVASSTGVQDNCKKEFKYATRRLTEAKMIPVIMEPGMKDGSRWTGPLAMELGGTLWVDMSDDAAVGATSNGFDQLCSEIDGRIPGRTSHGSSRASLFQSTVQPCAPVTPKGTDSAVAPNVSNISV